jgi:toxin ParE1/3/4
MAFRLKFSARALHEIGEAQEWYETQSPGLGAEFIAAMELQLKRFSKHRCFSLR